MNNPENTPLVFEELHARCLGEVDFAQSILDSFLATCGDQINEIANSVELGSREDVARSAHRFKGTAATVAAGPLRNVLEEIEVLARRQTQPDAESDSVLNQLVDKAREEIERLHQFIAASTQCLEFEKH